MFFVLFPFFFFFFNDTATTEIYTLSLHDALPISPRRRFAWPQPKREKTRGCSCRQKQSPRRRQRARSVARSTNVLVRRKEGRSSAMSATSAHHCKLRSRRPVRSGCE